MTIEEVQDPTTQPIVQASSVVENAVEIHSFPDEEEEHSQQRQSKGKRQRAKVSWAWKEVEKIDEGGEYVCKLCRYSFPKLGTIHYSISNVKSHLKKHHRIVFDSYSGNAKSSTDNNYKLLEWIYRRNLPYSTIEHEELKSLLNFVPKCRSTIVENYSKAIYADYKSYVIYFFKIYFIIFIVKLSRNTSHISLTSDSGAPAI